MKWTTRSLVELLVSVAMIAVVVVLAILQYRWTGEISRSEQNRLQSVLDTSVRNFTEDFSYDFERLCERYEIAPLPSASNVAAVAAKQYAQSLKSPFVANVYVVGLPDLHSSALIAVSGGRPQRVAWPAALTAAHDFTIDTASGLQSPMPDRQAQDFPWTFLPGIPAIIRPIFEVTSSDVSVAMSASPVAFLIVELDRAYLTKSYLPTLLDRDFVRQGFDVAVRTASKPYRAMYVSTPDFPVATASPDASFNLLDSVAEEARRRGHPVVQPVSQQSQWELVAQHSAGSLDLAVADWRRHNLVISLGLLAILSASLILVFSLARRSERFAELQMEFVAGVSHELCTPLSVIHSAVENLADGVVESPDQVNEYVHMLRDQSRRLESLLNQVLQFASARFSRSELMVHPVDIAKIVSESIQFSEPVLRAADFLVERDIACDLPQVDADISAAHKCVENLISNAVKYGALGQWIAVRVHPDSHGSKSEVLVSVQDKGMGISPKDARKIFTPFYRTRPAREGQFRGVGLGLFLVKEMMEAMGGSVTISSEVGKGSCFVLHFRVSSLPNGREQKDLNHAIKATAEG